MTAYEGYPMSVKEEFSWIIKKLEYIPHLISKMMKVARIELVTLERKVISFLMSKI